jgi:hypothetical protein
VTMEGYVGTSREASLHVGVVMDIVGSLVKVSSVSVLQIHIIC